MEYAVLFAFMGTWIVLLHYRNYKLMQGVRLMATMMDKLINEEVRVRRTHDGFEIEVKKT